MGTLRHTQTLKSQGAQLPRDSARQGSLAAPSSLLVAFPSCLSDRLHSVLTPHPAACAVTSMYTLPVRGRAALWTFSRTMSCTRTMRQGCRWTGTYLEETAHAASEARRHRRLLVRRSKLAPPRPHALRETTDTNPTNPKKFGRMVMCPYCGR